MIGSTNIYSKRSRYIGIIKYCAIFVFACMSIHVHGQTATLEENPGLAQTLAISPNGKILATVSSALGLQLHLLPDYSLLPALEHQVLKNQPGFVPRGIAFSDDSKQIAIVHDRRLLVFELPTQRLISDAFIVDHYTGQNYGTAFISPSQIAVSASGLGTALVESIDAGSAFSKVRKIGTFPRGGRAVFSIDGKFVAMRAEGNVIERYDLTEDAREGMPKRFAVSEGTYADVLAATSDGKFLAVHISEFVSKDVAERKSWAKVNLFSTETGKSVASLPIPHGSLTPVAKFLPGTMALAIASPGGGLQLLDFSTGDVSQLIETFGSVVDLVLDKSGNTLVTLDIKGNLRHTDLKTLVADVLKQQENAKKEAKRQMAEASLIAQRKINEERVATQKLRGSINIGDDTHCGMVVSVKKPIAEVQTVVGTRWFRFDQLFPIGMRECRFLNGVYQE